jgi:peptidoglycan/xylan/chitin deacetylase (PgdA/CDA1 family)
VHDAKDTAEALPHIIRALRKEGYTFVTISEMLAHLPNPVAVQTNAGPLKPKELAVLRTASASVPATQIETASKS